LSWPSDSTVDQIWTYPLMVVVSLILRDTPKPRMFGYIPLRTRMLTNLLFGSD
jgi:hypothetical protein